MGELHYSEVPQTPYTHSGRQVHGICSYQSLRNR